MCGKSAVAKTRPFCSKRCADIDLARWFDGSYAVPSQREEESHELEQALEQEEQREGSDTKH